MAFDGTVIANLTRDIAEASAEARISKIAQPENDTVLLQIKKTGLNTRLLISANPSYPMAYFTDNNRPSPATAPNFCMLLRKHIANGRILSVTQPGMDRIIRFEIEHFDDMGDTRKKHLYAEFMGKHSNIIFCDENDMILDSIKHISSNVSSLREVLPGRQYFIPESIEKRDPLALTEADEAEFAGLLAKAPKAVNKALYQTYNGISPVVASEICYRARIDADRPANVLGPDELSRLFDAFYGMVVDIKSGNFSPCIIYDGQKPLEFSSIELTMYADKETVKFDSISEVLEKFYYSKEMYERIRQKSTDLRKLVSTCLDRAVRKFDLQKKQLKDTEKRDKYRLYGELLSAYGYSIAPGEKKARLVDYNTGKEIDVPMDETLTPQENSQKYFARYQKLKRTYEALSVLLKETEEEIAHLRSIEESIMFSSDESDLSLIRTELFEAGYIKKRSGKSSGKMKKSKPLHFISSDGFDIYVGKNNYQNDQLTFKVANGGDWWFHAKNMPGSHVIVKTNGAEMTDKAYEEAGSAAAYFSAGKESPKVEIDYTMRREVKKPNGAKPGYVIYHTNYSLTAVPDISALKAAD
ncbi:MAG: NFACT family protein [Eubacterium sp.]|nr:NFACT family protein [Eubacterium sp.]